MLLNTVIDSITTTGCFPDNSIREIEFPSHFLEYKDAEFVLIYFYPGDFTSICATELLAFEQMDAEFTELGTIVVGCSVNGAEVHAAWKTTPKTDKGLGTMINHIPLADIDRQISKRFDVLIKDRNLATRGFFVLDKHAKVLVEHRSDTKTARDIMSILAILRDLKKINKDMKRDRDDSI